ncbi:TetR family transcriptional regulator [Paracoccus sp. FO-3]|uniref:TetR family transcriptional regulator n=1 Tax=Paracoccus sp. FO-3 TaxID=1335059 RepID=UPI0015E3B391|nr:TetR family transcriptional regulator [Paracoccus sp. FO-3]
MELLRSAGPTSVTLQAVARATGMTHGNVTHHFGTSSALHTELVARMAQDLASRADDAVTKLRRGDMAAEDVVDLVFAAFVDTGCGRLVGWLSATGDKQALSPIFEVLNASVRMFRTGEPLIAEPEKIGAGPIALEILSHALTESLIGSSLESATDMSAGSLRRIAAERIRALRAVEETSATSV